MGFLRGLGKLLGSTIFTTFLVLLILTMEIISFTSYDNFKSVASGIFEKQFFSKISEKELSDLKGFLIFQCSQTDRVSVPLFGGQPVVVKCSDVKNSDKSKLPTLITTALIDSIYYKKFDCSFIDCIKSRDPQKLLIVASNEGNQFYRSSQTYMWLGTGAGLAILLLSLETWVGRLKGVGFNLVFTGLPFFLIGYIQPLLTPSLSPDIESSVKPIIDGLTSPLKSKFIIISAVGAVFIVVGYVLGFYLSRKNGKK